MVVPASHQRHLWEVRLRPAGNAAAVCRLLAAPFAPLGAC